MPQDVKGVRHYDKNNKYDSPIIMDPLYDPSQPRRTNFDDFIDKVNNTRTVKMKNGKELKLRDHSSRTHFTRGEYSDKYERSGGPSLVADFIEGQAAKDAEATQKYNRKKMIENEQDSLGTSAAFGKTALGGTQSNSVKKDDRFRRGMNIKK
jgi:hypothetical protein